MSLPLSVPAPPPPEQVAAEPARGATAILTDGALLVMVFGPKPTRDAWVAVVLADLEPGGVEVVELAGGARRVWPIVKQGMS